MTAEPPATAETAVDLAVQLVRIDSVNPGLVPGAAGEAAIVDVLARRLARGGFVVEVVPAAMKGAVAAMVAAAETTAAAGTAGEVILALVADEEHASVGAEAVVGRLASRMPDACLVGEPTSLDLAVAHRGYAVVEVAFAGHVAHSAQAALGVNAVTHLGRLLTALETRHVELLAGPSHAVAGTGSLIGTVAHGGTSPFVLAAVASAVVERRTVPGEAAADGLLDVEHILAAMQRDDRSVQAVASVLHAREAWEYNDASPAGAALADALAASAAEPPWMR